MGAVLPITRRAGPEPAEPELRTGRVGTSADGRHGGTVRSGRFLDVGVPGLLTRRGIGVRRGE